MSITEYIESAVLSDVVRYKDHAAMDAVAFVGTLRKHPYDGDKCLLLAAAKDSPRLVAEGSIIEFRIADVLAADELPLSVDEEGAARSLVRIWVKRGALALRYEPFEVGDTLLGPRDSAILRKRFSGFVSTTTKGR
ncbi:MAG: hypothetical protein GXY71_06810 [Treponema sp.]|nr:hypothetical protein [Treponema sp.]HAP55673.1 hypothetical protein [Spirochaetaceae bacterium]